jgi:hypothetical protein
VLKMENVQIGLPAQITTTYRPAYQGHNEEFYLMKNCTDHDGIALASLTAGDVIRIQTMKSTYHLVLLDPLSGEALVEGGSLLTGPVKATVCGAAGGGSMIKIGWVVIGLRLEIAAQNMLIRTSPVISVVVEREVAEGVTASQAVTPAHCLPLSHPEESPVSAIAGG